jgi:hypothetical protein
MGQRKINDGFKDIMAREAVNHFMNMCFTRAPVTNGDTSGNIGFTSYAQSYIVYTIDGKFYSAPIITSGYAIGQSGMSNVDSGKARLYAICLTSNQSIVLWAGSQVSAGVTAYINTVPTSQCCVGTVLISNGATTSWKAGSAIGSAAPSEWTPVACIPQGVILSD